MSLSKKQSWILAFALSAIMWVTRGHHTASIAHLPDASWAIFFAVGVYFSGFAMIALFLVQACLIDYLVVTQLGIGESCFTIAYPFLIPAYLSMWVAGKWLSNHCALNVGSLRNFLVAAFSGTVVCELISSGSYYAFNVPQSASLGEFLARFAQYLPNALSITFGYLLVALVAHLVVSVISEKMALSN